MNELEIFTEALLRTTDAERAAYLDEACGSDGPLRQRIEKLLQLHESGAALLDQRPGELLNALNTPSRQTDDGPTSAEAAAKLLVPYLAPATRPDSIGRLGRYDVLQVIGQGGFGIVVKAFDEGLHRVVAIKVLAPHLALTSPPRRRFLREARAAALVKHENVVQIYAVEEEPLPCLVMEYIDGQTLQQRLDGAGPLEPAEVVRLGRQVALGLAAAHEKGLIHRDVKPANILLEAGIEPRAKLTDFGVARAADDASMTQSGVVAGTPMYMAPEQARDAPLDHRADLFSLGSVLYTMTCGRPPFRAPNTLAVLKRVSDDAPRPLPQVLAGVPDGLCAVIARLHEKDPADRFATAHETADALARCLTEPVPAPRAARRRAKLVYAAVAAVVLVLATGGAWLGGLFAEQPRAGGSDVAAGSGEGASPPSAFMVTSLLDDGSTGTLRWAVNKANLREGEDAITFDPTVFDVPRTITLTKGPLHLIDPAQTTITGPAAGLTISGDDKVQVFIVGDRYEVLEHAARASIADLTIAHGRGTGEYRLGGGVLCRGGATLALTGCTLRDNAAPEEGGGGVYSHLSTVTLTNCTLTRNRAISGAAIKNWAGVVTATNCTIVGNVAEEWIGGIHTLGHDKARTEVSNCILDNGGTENLLLGHGGLEITGDYNLTSDDSAPGSHSLRNTKPMLGPLGRHGGPTETIPLLPGSPGLDAGGVERIPPGVRTDQRGLPRTRNGKVDIGAFQVQ